MKRVSAPSTKDALRAGTAGVGLVLLVLPNVGATIEFETGIKHRSLVELVPPIVTMAFNDHRQGETAFAYHNRLIAQGLDRGEAAWRAGAASLTGAAGRPQSEWAPTALSLWTTAAEAGHTDAAIGACRITIARTPTITPSVQSTCDIATRELSRRGYTIPPATIAETYRQCRTNTKPSKCIRATQSAFTRLGNGRTTTMPNVSFLTWVGRWEASAGNWHLARRIWGLEAKRGGRSAILYRYFGVPRSREKWATTPLESWWRTLWLAASGAIDLTSHGRGAQTQPYRPWSSTRTAFERLAITGRSTDMLAYALTRIGERWTALSLKVPALACSPTSLQGYTAPPLTAKRVWHEHRCTLNTGSPEIRTAFAPERWEHDAIETMAWLLLTYERHRNFDWLTAVNAIADTSAGLGAQALITPLWKMTGNRLREAVRYRARQLDTTIPRNTMIGNHWLASRYPGTINDISSGTSIE